MGGLGLYYGPTPPQLELQRIVESPNCPHLDTGRAGKRASSSRDRVLVRDDDRGSGGVLGFALWWWIRRYCGRITAREHLGSEASHRGVGLDVQISKHRPAIPTPDETDAGAIDAGVEECHGAGGAESADGDLRWRDVVASAVE